MSSPAQYVEKIATFTAVQWDYTPEAAAWIMEVYADAAKRVGDDIMIQGSVHNRALEQGAWVVRPDLPDAVPVIYEDWLFERQFETT